MSLSLINRFGIMTSTILTPLITWFGSRGVWSGSGYSVTIWGVMNYITIATLGNGTTFGNITPPRVKSASVSDGSRGVILAGRKANIALSNNIDYITFATLGNAAHFGYCTVLSRSAGISDGTRGVWGCGVTTGFVVPTSMEHITIATLGNSVTFGTIDQLYYDTGAVTDGNTAIFCGGYSAYTASAKFSIQVMNIPTLSNVTVRGSVLSGDRAEPAAVSAGSRGVILGGASMASIQYSSMDYINIPAMLVVGVFGNMTAMRWGFAGTSDNSRGVFGGGSTIYGSPTASATYNLVSRTTTEYITVATLANATSFGTLTNSFGQPTAISGA